MVAMVSIEVPLEPGVNAKLDTLSEALGPPVAVGETEAESDTLPEKPRLFTVTVEVLVEPAVKVTETGFAERAKSDVTVTLSLTVWEMGERVAVTFTTYLPGGVKRVVATVTVEVFVPPVVKETLGGLKEAERPVTGGTLEESATLPDRPRLVIVAVDVPEDPATKAGTGVAEIVKSKTTETVIETECTRAPLVPVTVI